MDTLSAWHAVVASKDPARLDALLADDVVFRSPAVHAPQEGKALTTAYLSAALAVLGPTLTYHRQWVDNDGAVLEFTAVLDDRQVHGVDMIRWNDAGLITEFTVMARPLRGLERLIEQMRVRLTASA